MRDTGQYTLFLGPPFSVPEASKRPGSYAPHILAIASTFEMLRHLSLGSWPGTSIDQADADDSCDADRWCDVGPWEGEIEFQVTNERRIKELKWRLRPDSPEAISALEKAIRQADSLGLVPPKGSAVGLPAGTVRLGFGLSDRQLPKGTVAIGKVRLPYIRVTQPVRILHQPTPMFPAEAARLGATGAVRMQFIVSEDGRVLQESVRVMQADYAEFIDPSVKAILASRFEPARAGGCPVKLLVQQRVWFRQR